jgi:hypothetical protein
MRVLLVSIKHPGGDQTPPGNGSATPDVAASLAEQGFHVETMERLKIRLALLHQLKRLFYSVIMRKTYLPDRNMGVAVSFARQIMRRLNRNNIDLVLSLSSVPVARLRTELPVITWTDASFTTLKEHNESYANLCVETWRDGARLEQSAFTHVDAVCYTSQWAIDSALEHYSIQKAKLHLVPTNGEVSDAGNRLADLFRLISS